jgi:hypothetical protein
MKLCVYRINIFSNAFPEQKKNFPPEFSKTNKIAAKFKSLSAVQIKNFK